MNILSVMKRQGDVNNTSTMYTQLQRNFHQPLQPKRLLIVNITQNQQLPSNWKGVPTDIETLISYNARDNGFSSDTFQIEYGQHMTTNRFMAAQNTIDSRRSVIVTWSPIRLHSFVMPECWPSYLQ